MKKRVVLLTILCFACAQVMPVMAQEASDIDKILQEGKQAYMDGNFQEAVSKLSLAITLIKNKKDLLDAHLALAQTYFSIGNNPEAEKSINEILKINPKLVLSEDANSPKFISFFELVKRANLLKVTLKVQSSGAIYIDDIPFGEGDQVEARLFKGRHLARVERKGTGPQQEEFLVEKDGDVIELAVAGKRPSVQPETKEAKLEVPGARANKKGRKISKLLFILGGVVVLGVVTLLLLSKKESAKGEEIIIDNRDAGFAIEMGEWGTCYGQECQGIPYGPDFYYADPRAPGEQQAHHRARFTPVIGKTGEYEVYMWWPRGDDRATAAPVIINHGGGATVLTINLRQNGNGWTRLGAFRFVKGSAGSIVLEDSDTGFANADAVRFVGIN